MTERYSETQVISSIGRLTSARLTRLIRAEIVQPVQSDAGPRFRDVDVARLELLCDLMDDFELEEDTLGLVISLVDRLHAIRSDLRRVLAAVEAEPEDVRNRILAAVINGT